MDVKNCDRPTDRQTEGRSLKSYPYLVIFIREEITIFWKIFTPECKSKFSSIMVIGLQLMTMGKGSRLAAISFTCENYMGKGREWYCLFILGWEMGIDLIFFVGKEEVRNFFSSQVI